MRIDRLLSITIMMLNRDRVTAKELSNKFEISIRTIYRDLDALLLAGIPIMSFPGNEGGYGLIENYKINHRLLSLNEMLSILSSLKSINVSLKNKEYDSAMEKIKSLIPDDKKEEIENQSEQIVLDFLPWGNNKNQKKNLENIHKAIVNSKIIKFSYINNKGEKISRETEPMTLFFKGYGWYLFGYCLIKKDYRIFRLTRIKNLHVKNSSFIKRKKSYKELSRSEFIDKDKIELVIKFSQDVRVWVEDAFDEHEINELPESQLIVRTISSNADWIYPWILSFGDSAEVLQPLCIREKMLKISKNIYKKYQT